MVRPLHDAHVAVQDGEQVFAQVRSGTEPPSPALDSKVKKFITERDLKDAPYRQDFANGRITYAGLPGRAAGQGYLRISGFGEYAPDGGGSDVMVRDLPGGMTAFLPNEEFLNRDRAVGVLRGGTDAGR